MKYKAYSDDQFKVIIDQHREALVDSNEATDFIAAYLMKIAEEEKSDIVDSSYSGEKVTFILLDTTIM
jgi:hypothetical protein